MKKLAILLAACFAVSSLTGCTGSEVSHINEPATGAASQATIASDSPTPSISERSQEISPELPAPSPSKEAVSKSPTSSSSTKKNNKTAKKEQTPPKSDKPKKSTSKPKSTEKPVPARPSPTQKPKASETPMQEVQVLGSSFKNSVLSAINETRSEYGNLPLKLDGSLCAKALEHAKQMAKKGKLFHSCGGAESVCNSKESGRSIGIRSAAHATGLALDADRSRLGVGAVTVDGKQYTCVFAPRD